MGAQDGNVADMIPAGAGSKRLREVAARCRPCPLWGQGTQTVFGEEDTDVRLLLVGERPGDREDRLGRSFDWGGRLLGRLAICFSWPWQRRGSTRRRLPRQLREALPRGALGNAPHATDAQRGRGRGLPSMAGSGACRGPPGGSGLLGVAFWVKCQRGGWVKASLHRSSILQFPNEAQREAAIRGPDAGRSVAAAACSARDARGTFGVGKPGECGGRKLAVGAMTMAAFRWAV